jgi:transglutaminase-like putative cysteine protease
MLLSITHQTDLTYTNYISESVMELRMAPQQEKNQHRLSFNLAIGPASKVKSYFDWLGNSVHAFSINALHNEIQIIATSVVETLYQPVRLESLSDRWQKDGVYDYTLLDFLQFGGPVVDTPMLRELAASLVASVSRGNDPVRLGDLLSAILKIIDDDFTYEKGVTTSASPITEILAHRRGVCQDFTHLMIGLARACNIPARYVSGYIHPDRERFRGYSQTHAWVEVFAPSLGWVGLDPTNNCVAGENFVKVALGRNYQDVPPNKGVYKGDSKEAINVAVQSEQLESIPSELAAERTTALNIPVFAGNIDEQMQQIKQQQEQQQQ